MIKFKRSYIPESEYKLLADALAAKPLEWYRQFFDHEPTATEITDYINRSLDDRRKDMIWLSDTYQVAIREAETGKDFPPMLHLSIKRRDREPIHDWRDLQAIKDELIGPEHEGVELYPAHSRVIDTANQYHMFVLKQPGLRFPFGFDSTRLVSDEPIGKSKQRALK